MTKRDEMYLFLKAIENKKKMTYFLINIFNYKDFNDYNYIARVSMKGKSVILDVYDNVTDNRFNRYYFDFCSNESIYYVKEINNVFVNYINVLSLINPDSNLLKFAYLFKLTYKKRLTYARTFLKEDFIDILEKNNSI